MFKCSVNEIYSIFSKIANERKLYVPADNKDGNAVYQVNVWKELYKERFNKTIPDDALIVPLDMT